MRVEVRVKGPKHFNRTEGGKVKSYPTGAKLTVSQHVYESFRHQLEAIGEAPEPGTPPRGAAPGTDDAPDTDLTSGDELEQARIAGIVGELAQVGLHVDPAKVGAWTEKELERLPKLLERDGKQPPKFVTEALVASS